MLVLEAVHYALHLGRRGGFQLVDHRVEFHVVHTALVRAILDDPKQPFTVLRRAGGGDRPVLFPCALDLARTQLFPLCGEGRNIFVAQLLPLCFGQVFLRRQRAALPLPLHRQPSGALGQPAQHGNLVGILRPPLRH